MANPKNKVHILIPQINTSVRRTLCRPTAGYPNSYMFEYTAEITPLSSGKLCKTCEKYAKDIDKGEWERQWLISDRDWENAGGVI